jgi:hypothetical protein
MIGMFLKKNFYDGWDHLFRMVLISLSADVIIVAFLLSTKLSETPCAIVQLLSLLLAGFFSIALSPTMIRWTGHASPFSGVAELFRKKAGHMALVFLFLGIIWFFISFVLPQYSRQDSFQYTLLCVLIYWLIAFIVMILQYFVPLSVIEETDSPLDSFAKATTLLFGNLGFSVFLLLFNIVNLLISVVFVSLVPGLGGIMLTNAEATLMRMKRYENAETAAMKSVPWCDILEKDYERVKDRKLSDILFPNRFQK